MATEKTKKELPKVYAVTGSIQPSDFYLRQTREDDVENLLSKNSLKEILKSNFLSKISITSKQGFVGTVSNYMNEKAKSKQSLESPNPGARDTCFLNNDCDTLCVTGSIKLVGLYHSPSISDSPEFTDVHKEFVTNFLKDTEAFKSLIKQYLNNIKNGIFLWRNKYGFNRKTLVFLRTGQESFKCLLNDDLDFSTLVDKIAAYFSVNGSVVLLEIASFIELGAGAEVYPSQPFVGDKSRHPHVDGEKNYGRLLSEKDGCAILHSQKVGNAIRRVDVWYSDAPEAEPIAVEAYGVVTTQRAVKRNKNNSFYDYFNFDKLPLLKSSDKDAAFVLAMLIKGGVFGQQE